MQIQDPLDAKRAEDARVEAGIKAIQEERALEAAKRQAERWDKAMTRTFKGIRSRRQRHDVMEREAS